MKEKDITKLIKYIICGSFFLISIWGTIIIISKAFGDDIWYDEVFSVFFAKGSFHDIVRLTSKDVHPPLYYFYLKLFSDTAKLIFPSASYIVLCKIASIMPLLAIEAISILYITKKYGIICSSVFNMLITIMPALPSYYVEIRMYSFAMLIIFVAFLFGGRIVENRKNVSFIVFAILGIMAAYTQYFACVAIIGLYVFLGVTLIKKKDKRSIVRLIICALLSVVLYIPWIPRFLSQVSEVSGSYWIQPMGAKSIFGCVKFIFLPMPGLKGYLSAILAIGAVVAIYITCAIKKKITDENVYYMLASFAMLAMIILTGYVCSFLGRPIFVYRYMIPVLAVFFFGIARAFSLVANETNIYRFVIAIPFIITGYYSINVINLEESNKLSKAPEAMEALKNIPEDSVIIANFNQVATLMNFYIPDNRIYVYEGDVDKIVSIMFDNDTQMLGEDDLYDVVKDNDNVFFFGSFVARDELLSNWSLEGIDNELINDSCLIERYYFNIYRLKAR